MATNIKASLCLHPDFHLRRSESAANRFRHLRFGTAVPNCTYVYSPIGNIDNKCGVVFTYGDAMHPSAVTFNPATGKTYTYDANFKFNQDRSK